MPALSPTNPFRLTKERMLVPMLIALMDQGSFSIRRAQSNSRAVASVSSCLSRLVRQLIFLKTKQRAIGCPVPPWFFYWPASCALIRALFVKIGNADNALLLLQPSTTFTKAYPAYYLSRLIDQLIGMTPGHTLLPTVQSVTCAQVI
jgi:hypothetical protein